MTPDALRAALRHLAAMPDCPPGLRPRLQVEAARAEDVLDRRREAFAGWLRRRMGLPDVGEACRVAGEAVAAGM